MTSAIGNAGNIIDINGRKIFYIDRGKGLPLLLLHPAPGSSSSYKNLIAVLSKTYRCIAPDFKGSGRSDKPKGDYSIHSQAGDIIFFLKKLNLPQAFFIGCSFGAIVALYIAERRRELVKQLFISGCNAYINFKFPLKARIFSSFMGKYIMPFATKDIFTNNYTEQFYNPSVVTKNDMDLLWKELSQKNGMYCLWKQSSQIDFSLTEPLLKKITAPTVIIWGENDNASPLKWAYKLKDDIPLAKLCVIKNCGHFPLVEKPNDAAEIIMNSLR